MKKALKALLLGTALALAVSSLALHDWTIVGRAGFLFMTNALAIAPCSTVMARWYGFCAHNGPTNMLWRSLLVIVTFAVISVPLASALRQIAHESWLAKQVLGTLPSYFSGGLLRVDPLSVRQDATDGIVAIDAGGKHVVVCALAGPGVTLAALAAAGTRLRQEFSAINSELLPTMALALITFPLGKAMPDVQGEQELQVIRWALDRWQANRIAVTAFAGTFERGAALQPLRAGAPARTAGCREVHCGRVPDDTTSGLSGRRPVAPATGPGCAAVTGRAGGDRA